MNVVVVDSGWEGRAAKTLDDLADEGHVVSWVKNAFLDFHIPYIDSAGEQRNYFPDFIVRCRNGSKMNLIVEITGMSKDKPQKKWTVENRWLPAVNLIREQYGWDRWDFLEIENETRLADFRNEILKKIAHAEPAKPARDVWSERAEYERESGQMTEDFELPERRVDVSRWGKNPVED